MDAGIASPQPAREGSIAAAASAPDLPWKQIAWFVGLIVILYFPLLKQTRELGLQRLPDGGIRAIYNRTRKGEYSIKDGKITASGEPTPPQFRCGE